MEEQRVEAAPRRVNLTALVLLLGIALVALAAGLEWASQHQTDSGAAPDFELTSYDGQAMRLSDLRGRVVVVNFWGSWCAPCREETPDLQRIHEDYRDRGVVLLGITYLDVDSDAQAFISDMKLTYINGADPDGRIARAFGVQAAPTTYVINREGIIASFVAGPVNAASLRATLDALLAQ